MYKEIAKSTDANLFVECQLSLVAILMHSKKYTEAIKKLLILIETIDIKIIQLNVQASLWQLLGDAYSNNGDYKEAFINFDKSIDLYRAAIDKFGMNVIDGLYHLYEGYAWTYANAEDYNGAVEMFNTCLQLSVKFELGLKKGKALLDYGFHLIMTKHFKSASAILSENYSFIIDNNLIDDSDMSFIYGNLFFAHWYSGAFIESVELLGLYINACYEKNSKPIISIIEQDGMREEINIIHFFRKRMYILIIPIGNTYQNFNEWINEVITKRPELSEPLSHFKMIKNPDA